MTKTILALFSGLVIGLTSGLLAGSSFLLEPPLSCEEGNEEHLFRGQPTSFWIKQLHDRDPSVRQQAMWALAHLGPRQEGTVHALVEMLEDRSEEDRFGAALNLGRMGPGADSAPPLLLAALRDEDQFVRLAAVRALGSIRPMMRRFSRP
jgi:hypothetical protein